MTSLELLLAAVALAGLEMAALWLIQLRAGNATAVEVGWPAGVLAIALLHALYGQGYEPRRLLAVGMVGLWGLRLAAYRYLTRVRSHVEPGGRSPPSRDEGEPPAQWSAFAFSQLQAGLAALYSLPMWLMVRNDVPELSPVEWLGAGVWLAGLFGESVADTQWKRFEGDPRHRGHVCQEGLWHYSRHPNRFFDWLTWVGFFLAALASPWGWLAIVCPALLLYLLFKATGIPAAEAEALRTKGEPYREYQRTTHVFVPWFRKA